VSHVAEDYGQAPEYGTYPSNDPLSKSKDIHIGSRVLVKKYEAAEGDTGQSFPGVVRAIFFDKDDDLVLVVESISRKEGEDMIVVVYPEDLEVME